MTIFVTWQSRVTVDSIRNSCDVYFWHTKSDPWDLTMTMTMTMTMTSETSETSETSVKTILQTCDNWDTDYNSYNWEPEFMTIFVTWQSRVTLDSIRNSCDVLKRNFKKSFLGHPSLQQQSTWHICENLAHSAKYTGGIIVTWQLRVTLDSIRNSCDVSTH